MRRSSTGREGGEAAAGPDPEAVWAAVRAAADLVRSGRVPARPTTFAAEAGGLRPVGPGEGTPRLTWHPGDGWSAGPGWPAHLRDMLDLYLPICRAGAVEPLAVGHLGQSLDGFIATNAGDSCWVTGRENILHLHRMRALSDAVLVGAETVASDDPRLTTRLVPGPSPVRVVMDPRRRLPAGLKVFEDGEAPTLLLCAADRVAAAGDRHGQAEVVGVPLGPATGRLDLGALIEVLRGRGLGSLFIEGGGVTVSAFLRAGLLDRLQVAVAPVLVGEGRRGVRLPPAGSMRACLRPRCRLFRMGGDVLFDCEPAREAGSEADDAGPGLARIT